MWIHSSSELGWFIASLWLWSVFLRRLSPRISFFLPSQLNPPPSPVFIPTLFEVLVLRNEIANVCTHHRFYNSGHMSRRGSAFPFFISNPLAVHPSTSKCTALGSVMTVIPRAQLTHISPRESGEWQCQATCLNLKHFNLCLLGIPRDTPMAGLECLIYE